MKKDIDALQEAIYDQSSYIQEKSYKLTTPEIIEEKYRLEMMTAALHRLEALAEYEESWDF